MPMFVNTINQHLGVFISILSVKIRYKYVARVVTSKEVMTPVTKEKTATGRERRIKVRSTR